jgi:hypothetical protein
MFTVILEKSVEWWSRGADMLGITAAILGGLLALVTLVGWTFSWKAGKLKDDALKRYQATATQSIAEANKVASIANQQAASANLELATLQAKVAPRRLTKEQQDKLASEVKAFAPQVASVWYGAGDKESETFSWEIAAGLHAAGWTVFSPASTVTLAASGKEFGATSRLQTGVVVASTSDEHSLKAADAVVAELSALGFDATKAPKTEDRAEPVVIVTVEARPEGAQGEQKLKDSIK